MVGLGDKRVDEEPFLSGVSWSEGSWSSSLWRVRCGTGRGEVVAVRMRGRTVEVGDVADGGGLEVDEAIVEFDSCADVLARSTSDWIPLCRSSLATTSISSMTVAEEGSGRLRELDDWRSKG